jgi:hypothetical protein
MNRALRFSKLFIILLNSNIAAFNIFLQNIRPNYFSLSGYDPLTNGSAAVLTGVGRKYMM